MGLRVPLGIPRVRHSCRRVRHHLGRCAGSWTSPPVRGRAGDLRIRRAARGSRRRRIGRGVALRGRCLGDPSRHAPSSPEPPAQAARPPTGSVRRRHPLHGARHRVHLRFRRTHRRCLESRCRSPRGPRGARGLLEPARGRADGCRCRTHPCGDRALGGLRGVVPGRPSKRHTRRCIRASLGAAVTGHAMAPSGGCVVAPGARPTADRRRGGKLDASRLHAPPAERPHRTVVDVRVRCGAGRRHRLADPGWAMVARGRRAAHSRRRCRTPCGPAVSPQERRARSYGADDLPWRRRPSGWGACGGCRAPSGVGPGTRPATGYRALPPASGGCRSRGAALASRADGRHARRRFGGDRGAAPQRAVDQSPDGAERELARAAHLIRMLRRNPGR